MEPLNGTKEPPILNCTPLGAAPPGSAMSQGNCRGRLVMRLAVSPSPGMVASCGDQTSLDFNWPAGKPPSNGLMEKPSSDWLIGKSSSN